MKNVERESFAEAHSVSKAVEPGLMDDGIMPFYPGVNCLHCGRFVGRDGYIYIEHFEMSSTIASLDGECRRCIDASTALDTERGARLSNPVLGVSGLC